MATETSLRYDPSARYEFTTSDVEYLRHGDTAYLARIYQPRGAGPFPALLNVHGGAWGGGDRMMNHVVDEALAASGIVVAAIDFRSSHEAPYPASLQDVNYATRWLKAHASDFGGSPERAGVIGFSSGGHLAMLSAMRHNDARNAALPLAEAPDLDATAAYVIMGWPVIDPLSRFRFAKEKGAQPHVEAGIRYFGDEAGMAEANPQMLLERGETVALPPALLVQGSDDAALTPGMPERFVESYARAGGVIELGKYPGAPHGFMREGGPNAERAIEQVKGFIARQLA